MVAVLEEVIRGFDRRWRLTGDGPDAGQAARASCPMQVIANPLGRQIRDMQLSPIPTSSTRLIAQRTLMFVGSRRRERIQVRIGKPVRDVPTAGGLDWRCPISITKSHRSRQLRGIGVDSLQALIHALKIVEMELRARERDRKGRFEWLGESWHGVPEIRLSRIPTTRPNRRLQPTKAHRPGARRATAPSRFRG
jgi:hypothetical protein